MKKVLKIIAMILGGILLIVVFGAMYINFKGIPTYEVQAPDLKVERDSQSIANGMKLTTLVCNQCHMGKNSRVLEGKQMEDAESAFGTVWAPNITVHPQKGIGRYTDGELAFLLRTGVKKNGQYSPPWMPKFPHIAEEDIQDIIAFLRSDHPSLQASEKVQPNSQPSFLVKVLTNTVFEPFPYPKNVIEKPNESDRIAYGEYLANAVYQCFSCHSADFKTLDELVPENSKGFYGGGTKMLDLDEKEIYTSNITMDKVHGIGKWTEANFIKAVKWGSRPDGTPIMFPMNKYTLLEDEEVAAIWAYLQTVPVMKNEVVHVAME